MIKETDIGVRPKIVVKDGEVDLKVGAISVEADHMITEVENVMYLKRGVERAKKLWRTKQRLKWLRK